jgi:two-component system, OmpR family, sensor kinase
LSLRTRVTLSTIAVLGVGLAVISIALNLLLADRLSADASAVLANRADAVASTLDTHTGRLILREAPDDAALDEHAWVFDRQGRALERSPATPEVARAVRSLMHVTRPTELAATEHIRLLGRPVGDAGVAVVGVSLDPYGHTERLAGAGTVVLDVFVLLAGALVARRAVGAALRPVADMTARAAEWSEHDLHRRFALGPPVDELTALAATLDGLLGRLDAALRHEQRFSAEMAHELRTPLAGVRGEAELALRANRSDADRRAALEAVLAGTDRMANVVETLLVAERSDAVGGSSDAVAAGRSVEQLVRPTAEAHDRQLIVHVLDEPLTVGTSEEVVTGALHPLLENAVRHASRAVTSNWRAMTARS